MLDNSERGELVMTLVDAALEQPPESRSSYLQSACQHDAALREEVQKRVEWEEKIRSFLRAAVDNTLRSIDPSFEPGEHLAGRFRVIGEVGRGGMGVVYEAFDEKLQRRVAIKSAQSGYGHRLPPEARAAREVSHFNVCKVYDLHSAQTELGEVEFLTMELIEGETLSARVKRAGPLPLSEARDITLQIAAGLAQAHRQGVVHGDLKCGNVILAQLPEGGTRAVVTDFGLASLKLASGEGGTESQQGGSFDYMAPELLSGAHASVASDLYALGVVFHVMLTGGVPARQENDPHSLRQCKQLPSPWAEIVARCLESSPENRFTSVGELADRLARRSRVRRWVRPSSAAAAILAALFWLGPQRSTAPIRLAVLPFVVDGTPVDAAAGLALDVADRLSGLRRGLVVIPPAEAQRNRVDTLDGAKTVLAATHVLRTRLNNTGKQITVLASIVDIGSGHALQELKGTYSSNDIVLLAKALNATVTGALHLRAGVPVEFVTAAAYPYYLQGINLLRRDTVSADEAIPFLRKAIELDPNSALPYAGLAEAQIQKFQRGYGHEWLDLSAQSVAKAQSLNSDSAPVLLSAGLFKQQHGWYEQAAQDFGRAVELSPNNAEGWNRLAVAYSRMNRADEAVSTYQRAIRAQPDYYAPYIEFGQFYYFRGQFREAEKLFRHVTSIAPGLARGHMDLGLALKEQARYQEAEQSLLTALRLQETSQILTNIGFLYYQEERYVEAARYFEKSVNTDPPTAVRFMDLGDAYRHLGNPEAAAENYRRAQRMAESVVSQNPREPYSRARLAFLSAQLDDPRRAEFEITQALNLSPDDTVVMWEAAITFEALGERDKTLDVLSRAPWRLLDELSRQPDVKELRRDPHFQELLRNKITQP